MPFAPLLVLSVLSAAPAPTELSAQAPRSLFELEVTASRFSAPTLYMSVLTPDPAPLPAPSWGASGAVLLRLSPLDATWLSERFSLGLGASWTQWQLRSREGTMWQLGLPFDARFNLLTGAVRPWVGFRSTLSWMNGSAVPEDNGRFASTHALRAGLDVRPNEAWAISAHAGWNNQDAPALGAATYMQWVEIGLSVSHRIGG